MPRFLENIQKIFLGEGEHKEITFDTMKGYPLFKWEEFINKIKIMKVFDDGKNLVFLTVIPKGTRFGVHSHDCLERCYVVDGWLDDGMTKEQKIGGQVMTYPAHIPHEPFAKDETILTVSFKKKKLEK